MPKTILFILILTILIFIGYCFDKYGKTNKEELEEAPTETENIEEREK